MSDETVLVTGGSGFLAAHCIGQLLDRGYHVRATVRDAAKAESVGETVRAAGAADTERLYFGVADLTRDEGWADALAGCTAVLHVASPFPSAQPKDENEVIRPAREGTLRVLRAARDAGVHRAVVTSSFAAVGYGHPPTGRAFTETDWTDLSGHGITPYVKSKTLAERAAWDFVQAEGGGLELTVVNPVGIFGPALNRHLSGSLQLIQAMMTGRMPAIPHLHTPVVDVRDVADLHLRAMTSPRAAGQRFLAAAGDTVSFLDLARTLRAHLGEAARRTPTRSMPNLLVRAAGLVVPAMREMSGNLGVIRHVDNTRARSELGWKPRSADDAIVASGQSLIDLGLTTATH